MNNLLHGLLPSKLYEVLERAGICSIQEIITLSLYDFKKITNLCYEDIDLIKNIVSGHFCPKSITCDLLQTAKRVPTGCDELNKILMGGYRTGTITEIYGESGSGKTQLAMQCALQNWQTGSVFICTEDLFPVKRFEQLKQGLLEFNQNIDYGKNVFVEHITEAHELLACIKVRLPKLLIKHKPSLIIIDSVAASFRSESTNYIQRAEELREMAIALIKVAQEYNLAVLCLNQVTGSFDENFEVLPSLGLAWSNMISTRLWIKKTTSCINVKSLSLRRSIKNDFDVYVREVHVMFAPDIPNNVMKFVITENGVIGIE